MGSANLSAWFPEWASTFAPGVDMVFYDLYFVGLIVLILTVGLAVTFMFAFRRRSGDPEQVPAGGLNKCLLGAWMLGTIALGGFAFMAGLGEFVDSTVPPYDSYAIDITTREGAWDFAYPGGYVADTLRVPTGKPVLLALTSEDISRQLAIPAMRVQQAVLPGRTTETWFEPITPGTFPIYSGTFSSVRYDSLPVAMIALSEPDFASWLAAASDIFAGRTMAKVGEFLYVAQGCKACHSLDGSKLVGPSFKNLYGHEAVSTDGRTRKVDAGYVKESVLSPNAFVVEGFQGVMPTFDGKLDDRKIEAIVAYLESLSDHGEAGPQEDK